jgi:hypothetical protein
MSLEIASKRLKESIVGELAAVTDNPKAAEGIMNRYGNAYGYKAIWDISQGLVDFDEEDLSATFEVQEIVERWLEAKKASFVCMHLNKVDDNARNLSKEWTVMDGNLALRDINKTVAGHYDQVFGRLCGKKGTVESDGKGIYVTQSALESIANLLLSRDAGEPKVPLVNVPVASTVDFSRLAVAEAKLAQAYKMSKVKLAGLQPSPTSKAMYELIWQCSYWQPHATQVQGTLYEADVAFLASENVRFLGRTECQHCVFGEEGGKEFLWLPGLFKDLS